MTEITDSIEVPEPGQPEDETKKSRRGRRKKQGPLARLGTFYRQIIAELRKVVWPKRNDLMTYTSVVIVFVVIVIAIVTVIDWGFSEAVRQIFG